MCIVCFLEWHNVRGEQSSKSSNLLWYESQLKGYGVEYYVFKCHCY